MSELLGQDDVFSTRASEKAPGSPAGDGEGWDEKSGCEGSGLQSGGTSEDQREPSGATTAGTPAGPESLSPEAAAGAPARETCRVPRTGITSTPTPRVPSALATAPRPGTQGPLT